MVPEMELEARMRQVESDLAVMRQRVDDVARDVSELQPMVVELTKIDARLAGVEVNVGKIAMALEDRDTRATEERKAMRTALLTLTGVIAAAMISGIASVVVALL